MLTNSNSYISLTKTIAAQNEVALNYHRVRGQYFLAVVFVTAIVVLVFISVPPYFSYAKIVTVPILSIDANAYCNKQQIRILIDVVTTNMLLLYNSIQDSWLDKREDILARFTTSQKLTLSAASNIHQRSTCYICPILSLHFLYFSILYILSLSNSIPSFSLFLYTLYTFFIQLYPFIFSISLYSIYFLYPTLSLHFLYFSILYILSLSNSIPSFSLFLYTLYTFFIQLYPFIFSISLYSIYFLYPTLSFSFLSISLYTFFIQLCLLVFFLFLYILSLSNSVF